MKKKLKIAVSGNINQVMEMTVNYKSKDALVKKFIYFHESLSESLDKHDSCIVRFPMYPELTKLEMRLGWSHDKASALSKSIYKAAAKRKRAR